MKTRQILFVSACLLVVLVVAVLLAEIVPNPPLLAGDLKSVPVMMLGKWKGNARISVTESRPDDLVVSIEIRPDASVAGWIGGGPNLKVPAWPGIELRLDGGCT